MKHERGSKFAEVALFLVGLLFLIPIVLIFVTSFKPDAEILKFNSVLPAHPTTENFRQVLGTPEEFPVFRWFLNSVFVSTCVTLLVLAVDSLAAYGLSRLNLPGSKWVSAVIVGTMMVPGQILLVPMYLLLNRLGWIDSPAALIVPAGAGAFGVFMLSQFFRGIPKELEEAASMDGCSRIRAFLQILLPLVKPALATLAIFTFIGSWNDFLGPLVYLDSGEKYTLPVGVAIFQSSHYSDYGITLAACVACTLPILVVFLIFQRHIVQSIASAGLKD